MASGIGKILATITQFNLALQQASSEVAQQENDVLLRIQRTYEHQKNDKSGQVWSTGIGGTVSGLLTIAAGVFRDYENPLKGLATLASTSADTYSKHVDAQGMQHQSEATLNQNTLRRVQDAYQALQTNATTNINNISSILNNAQ